MAVVLLLRVAASSICLAIVAAASIYKKQLEPHAANGGLLRKDRLETITQSASEVALKRPSAASKVHLVSHRSCSQNQTEACNQEFIKQMNAMEAEAKTMSQISEVHLYTRLPDELMNDPRWQRHVAPHVRGRGFWFWKASIPLMLISKGVMQLGDVMVWNDADTPISFVKGLLEQADMNNSDVILHRQPHCEHVWTKGNIFDRFGVKWNDPHYGLTQQPKTNNILMRVNERTVRLLQHWESLMADFHLVSDEPTRGNSDGPWFKRKENRHDQSLLSMLLKASFSSAGSCDEPDFECDNLMRSGASETDSWEVHPEFGIHRLTVNHLR